MKPAKVNTLAACIAAIGFSPIIYAADNTPTVILDTVTVKGTRNKDEIGKNRVYTREIVRTGRDGRRSWRRCRTRYRGP